MHIRKKTSHSLFILAKKTAHPLQKIEEIRSRKEKYSRRKARYKKKPISV